MRTFKVYRYWPVEYQSIAEVEAATVEEACDIALHDDDDYSDAESCDGSDGPTEIGRVVEIVDGEEIEHDVPGDAQKVVAESIARAELLAWIADTRGCDLSCLAQLYSIICPDPVEVTADDGSDTGGAWDGGSPAACREET